jgi:preprotein translocase subunit SecA
MDYLKDGVGLRAYAQRDPLVEYQREGFDMFAQMLDGVKEEAVGFLFHYQPPEEQEITGVGAAPVRLRGQNQAAQRRQQQLLYSAPAIDGAAHGEGQVMVQEAPALGIGGSSSGAKSGGKATRPGGTSGAAGGSAASSGSGGAAAGTRPVASGPAAAAARLGGGSPGAQVANKQLSPGQVVGSGPSRNAPCPCGSGKKYKRCHGAPGA